MKTYPLRTFVHRVLLTRLGIAAALIASGVGLLTYVVQYSQLEKQAAELGRRGIQSLVDKVRHESDRRQIDAAIALRNVLGQGNPPVVYRAGRFVHVQFYDRATTILAQLAVPDQPGINEVKAFMASRPFTFPVPGYIKRQG